MENMTEKFLRRETDNKIFGILTVIKQSKVHSTLFYLYDNLTGEITEVYSKKLIQSYRVIIK